MADDQAEVQLKAEPAFRHVPYLQQKLNVTERSDGSILLTNGQPLRPAPRHMLAPLVYNAAVYPERAWLRQRDPERPDAEGWHTLTYAEGLRRVRSIAQALLDLELGPDAPLMVLSRNTIDHAIIMYAALWVGAPVCPITPAYSLLSSDHARLKYAIELLQPALIYAESGSEFQRAFDAIAHHEADIVVSRDLPQSVNSVDLLSTLETTHPTKAVDAAYNRLTGDLVAKYLLTSGSTGQPKAVINTHGMIASNVKMIRSVWDVDQLSDPQIMVSFLPWSHTFGGNAILHNMLDWGGTLYIDWGAPTPDKVATMLRNLRSVSPTQHTTVPAAWAILATEFEKDRSLAENFMKDLLVMSYGGAAMGQDIYERIQAVAMDVTGERISLSAGYGATETAPTTANVHWPNDTMGLIGLPIPGCEMKLAPVGEKFECRVKGPHITPGYYKNPEKTADAFDEEGFYKLGDAVKFKVPGDPNKGLAFDGRIAEEFKLMNGTWVSAGNVRVSAVAAVDGALSDAVICGINESYIGILGFLNQAYCQRLVGEQLDIADLAAHPKVVDAIRAGLEKHNAANPNAAGRIRRCILQTDMPSADAGEITDKGYINQSKSSERRADDVRLLFGSAHDNRMIEL